MARTMNDTTRLYRWKGSGLMANWLRGPYDAKAWPTRWKNEYGGTVQYLGINQLGCLEWFDVME